ncbi:hypothetical protein ILUMI_19905 [Ignelater luminosus]|uniref:Uncharacterized protein n=1 Tax=Ignelater luminosus TaxID=2038154 RepID=A0A8K0CFA2_IGNLU|nr:hypothetical protein ILUMI_19905 [Ignelater luminosus]
MSCLSVMAQKWEMKKPLTIKELEAIVEEVDTLKDKVDLNDDVLWEKGLLTDVAGTFEVHVELSDKDEPIAQPSTSMRKKVYKDIVNVIILENVMPLSNGSEVGNEETTYYKRIKSVVEEVDTLKDKVNLNDDVLLEKALLTDVAGTFEVHVESSDKDEPIAQP